MSAGDAGVGAGRAAIPARLDPELERALARLARAHGDREAIEVQWLKSRPGRRASCFLGRCRRSPFGMVVDWGVVLKRSSPRRAAEQLALHTALHRALSGGQGLPEVPGVVCARPPDGWIALEAWPGVPMAGDPDPARRGEQASRVARRLASLERSPRARRLWPARRWTGDDEMRRLEEVWARAGDALPRWARELASSLARSRAVVPAHRDLNAEQVILEPRAAAGKANARRWIDWDLAAQAPPGLDLGNLLAHERLTAIQGVMAAIDYRELRSGAIASYHEAGGRATGQELAAWEAAAALRLAGLALQRAQGDDPVARNPDWLPARSAGNGEARAIRSAAERVFAIARAGSRWLAEQA